MAGSARDPGVPPAKVRVPVRPTAVSRHDLIGRIVTSGRPVVTISAFAGAGKTSLIADWARTDERPVAWVGLDRSDDDPAVLGRSVALALASAGLCDPALVADVGDSTTGDDPTALLALLGHALLAAPMPFLVMLDDVHHLTNPATLSIVDGLIVHVPDGSALVLSGRTPPDFVATRRVEGLVFELDSSDLALSGGETGELLAAAGVEVSPDDVARIAAQTEGWAAGVYLCALVGQRDPEALRARSPLNGSSRHVADYLLGRCFEQTAEEVQEFLLVASVLDQMSAELCDEIRDASDSQDLLHRLEHENLFVIPLDDERRWYRFHSLFREFLLGELRRRRPDVRRQVELTAAAWCAASGMRDQAVEYLLRAGDDEQLGSALMRAIRPAFLDGRIATIDRWMASAGEGVIETLPPLACLAGWTNALAGSATQAERWASVAAKLDYAGTAEDGWASFESSRTALRALMCADGVAAMVEDAELVYELEPAWGPWRNTVTWLLGQARELAGDGAGARAMYEEVLRLDEMSTQPLLIAPVAVALLAMDEGDWERARRGVERAAAIAAARQPGQYIPLHLAQTASARLALHEGREDRARSHLDQAMRTRAVGTHAVPYAAVRSRLVLAEVHRGLGDRGAARALLAEVDAVLDRRPELGALLPAVVRVRNSLSDDPRLVVALTPAELRVLPYLPTHLSFAEIGTELYVSRHTVHTHAGSIYRKLNVSSRSAAVARAIELGLIRV